MKITGQLLQEMADKAGITVEEARDILAALDRLEKEQTAARSAVRKANRQKRLDQLTRQQC